MAPVHAGHSLGTRWLRRRLRQLAPGDPQCRWLTVRDIYHPAELRRPPGLPADIYIHPHPSGHGSIYISTDGLPVTHLLRIYILGPDLLLGTHLRGGIGKKGMLEWQSACISSGRTYAAGFLYTYLYTWACTPPGECAATLTLPTSYVHPLPRAPRPGPPLRHCTTDLPGAPARPRPLHLPLRPPTPSGQVPLPTGDRQPATAPLDRSWAAFGPRVQPPNRCGGPAANTPDHCDYRTAPPPGEGSRPGRCPLNAPLSPVKPAPGPRVARPPPCVQILPRPNRPTTRAPHRRPSRLANWQARGPAAITPSPGAGGRGPAGCFPVPRHRCPPAHRGGVCGHAGLCPPAHPRATVAPLGGGGKAPLPNRPPVPTEGVTTPGHTACQRGPRGPGPAAGDGSPPRARVVCCRGLPAIARGRIPPGALRW